jgi:hypothetical protein
VIHSKTIMRILCVPSLLLLSVTGHAAPPGIALLAHVHVQADIILLANLLPTDAPTAIRLAAAAAPLGSAPQIGAVRRFSRDAIRDAIEAAHLPLASFDIPESAIVRRTGHVATRTAIFNAIAQALAKENPSVASALQPDNLVYDPSTATSGIDTIFVVTQMQFDPSLQRARFRLQPKTSSHALPFYVTADLPASVSSRALHRISLRNSSQRVVPLTTPLANSLVDPRHHVVLHLHSSASDMLLSARPLQRGALGQMVRVRLRDSGKTFMARVTGSNSVDASF